MSSKDKGIRSRRKGLTRLVLSAKPAPEEIRARTAGRQQVWVWLPSVFAMVVIACESTKTFSAENTSGWIRPYLEQIFGHINDHVWYVAHYYVRKCGHLCWYGFLCLTYLRAWLLTLGRREGMGLWRWRMLSVVLALMGTFCVGGLDEWHQSYIPTRTGVFSDVLIDTSGGLLACLLVAVSFWWRPWRGKRHG